jgi:D-alanyl-D-alanine carboxypeptidase
MLKSVSITLCAVWGVLALIVGFSFLYSYILVARAETSDGQTTHKFLLASAYENQALDEIEASLEYEQFLEEFNPHGPIAHIPDNKMTGGEETSDTKFRPITTTLSFSRDNCPRPDEALPPSYDIIVNKEAGIDSYIPGFLVNVTNILPTKNGRQICLDETAALYLADLFGAAKSEGYDMTITSGYRSFATQSVLLDRSIERHGYASAARRVAPPGHSEHQLGTTVDLAAATNGYISAGAAFGNSPEYEWMLQNAESFGFVLSYPDGHQETTGYIFEPWHWRFVGAENVEKFNFTKKSE